MDKKYYILNQEVMNGTITIKIINTIIVGNDFDEARTKVKSMLNKNVPTDKVKIWQDNEEKLSFSIDGDWQISGHIENEEADIV